MAGPSWLVDGNRIATKIKCASATCESGKVVWKSNPSRSCPNCHHTIDNSDVLQDWPGLPRGVKFDPTDQEIIQHLLSKSGIGDDKPHPFIDEFIPTVVEEDGICYTHPRNLPGIKQDGTAAHFFHRAIKAYNTGTRKRRKIHGDDLGDVRWHKTGRTKPVFLNGAQKGCKKIMVLYVSSAKGDKAEKTNWVMHQYHLGTEEDEKDGQFVISKVFHQQQQLKQSDKNGGDISDVIDDIVAKTDPVTPKSVTPPPRNERRLDQKKEKLLTSMDSIAKDDDDVGYSDGVRQPEVSRSTDNDNTASEIPNLLPDYDGNQVDDEEPEWLLESGSQYNINSQQLAEGLSICDDLLLSQSPNRDGNEDDAVKKRSVFSDYAPEDLKKDLEDYRNTDLANIVLDTPPDFRLSQLEFGSQDSFLAWGGSKIGDD